MRKRKRKSGISCRWEEHRQQFVLSSCSGSKEKVKMKQTVFSMRDSISASSNPALPVWNAARGHKDKHLTHRVFFLSYVCLSPSLPEMLPKHSSIFLFFSLTKLQKFVTEKQKKEVKPKGHFTASWPLQASHYSQLAWVRFLKNNKMKIIKMGGSWRSSRSVFSCLLKGELAEMSNCSPLTPEHFL